MDESTRSLKVVLCLTRLPASLTYRSYRDTFHGRSFVAWWVDRVRTWYPSHELYVQCHTEEEQEELQELTGGLADIVCTAGLTRLARLRELAAILSARELVMVSEGFAFGPRDMLSQAIRHHDRRSNLCTDVRGMSIGTTPEIYDVRLLQHPLPSPLAAADDLIGAIRNWAHSRQHTQPRESASIQCEPFDAAAAYRVATGDVPERIAVVGPRDLEKQHS